MTGMFNKDPHEVFDFIIKLISQAKRRASGINLESIYHCLNRTILYLLSRPTDSIAAQMSILEALHKLTTHRSACVFDPFISGFSVLTQFTTINPFLALLSHITTPIYVYV